MEQEQSSIKTDSNDVGKKNHFNSVDTNGNEMHAMNM